MMNKRFLETKKLNSKAEKALKSAIDKLIDDHKRRRQPLIIWRNGKVLRISAAQLRSQG